jgi:hypothetical protein
MRVAPIGADSENSGRGPGRAPLIDEILCARDVRRDERPAPPPAFGCVMFREDDIGSVAAILEEARCYVLAHPVNAARGDDQVPPSR